MRCRPTDHSGYEQMKTLEKNLVCAICESACELSTRITLGMLVAIQNPPTSSNAGAPRKRLDDLLLIAYTPSNVTKRIWPFPSLQALRTGMVVSRTSAGHRSAPGSPASPLV